MAEQHQETPERPLLLMDDRIEAMLARLETQLEALTQGECQMDEFDQEMGD